MTEKKYFGIVDAVSAEGYIRNESDIIVVEFEHITRKNIEEILVVSLGKSEAIRLREILDERIDT